jgi:hypothetical protein
MSCVVYEGKFSYSLWGCVEVHFCIAPLPNSLQKPKAGFCKLCSPLARIPDTKDWVDVPCRLDVLALIRGAHIDLLQVDFFEEF